MAAASTPSSPIHWGVTSLGRIQPYVIGIAKRVEIGEAISVSGEGHGSQTENGDHEIRETHETGGLSLCP